MLKLIDDHSKILRSQPESGIGYQTVEASFFSGEVEKSIVFNAELLVAVEELEELKKFVSYKSLLSEPLKSSENIKEIRIIAISEFLKLDFSDNLQNPSLLPIKHTGDNEGFKRFSAYKYDKRVTPGGGLYPGTYATTVNDINVVPSGLSAVARYALPNPWPTKYVLTIVPPLDTEIRCGTVQPAFNQSGGGVEILFINGTPDQTVIGPYIIPEI